MPLVVAILIKTTTSAASFLPITPNPARYIAVFCAILFEMLRTSKRYRQKWQLANDGHESTPNMIRSSTIFLREGFCLFRSQLQPQRYNQYRRESISESWSTILKETRPGLDLKTWETKKKQKNLQEKKHKNGDLLPDRFKSSHKNTSTSIWSYIRSFRMEWGPGARYSGLQDHRCCWHAYGWFAVPRWKVLVTGGRSRYVRPTARYLGILSPDRMFFFATVLFAHLVNARLRCCLAIQYFFVCSLCMGYTRCTRGSRYKIEGLLGKVMTKAGRRATLIGLQWPHYY